MSVSTAVKLQFQDAQDKYRLISVLRPREDITDTDVKNAMDEILASRALATKNGVISTKKAAWKESKERTDYQIKW